MTLSAAAADVILKEGKIRIGWVDIKVREKKMIVRCYNCVGYGHIAVDCKEAKKTKPCFKCGGEGHLAATCLKPPRCAQCQKLGINSDHISGVASCTAYQRAAGKEGTARGNNKRGDG